MHIIPVLQVNKRLWGICLRLKVLLRADEMAQWVEGLADKPSDLSSILDTLTVEGGN